MDEYHALRHRIEAAEVGLSTAKDLLRGLDKTKPDKGSRNLDQVAAWQRRRREVVSNIDGFEEELGRLRTSVPAHGNKIQTLVERFRDRQKREQAEDREVRVLAKAIAAAMVELGLAEVPGGH
jgi:chromosome segregation ATPase